MNFFILFRTFVYPKGFFAMWKLQKYCIRVKCSNRDKILRGIDMVTIQLCGVTALFGIFLKTNMRFLDWGAGGPKRTLP